MALKWRWRERMRAAGKPTDRPNLVMGVNVQVCWDKFCRYWDVEPRLVPMEGERFHLDAPSRPSAHCDENTIGVVAILGSTFDGSYEPVAEIARGARRAGRRRRPRRAACTSTPPRAGSSRRSCSPTSCGTSSSRACSRSTPRATSTASCTRASAGRSGATPRRCPSDLVFNVNYLGGEHADVRAELLAAGQRGRRAVLHVPQPRASRATGAVQQALERRGPAHRRRDRGDRARTG